MIAVTGSTGLLGSAVVGGLAARGIEHVGVARSNADLSNFESTLAWFEKTRPEIVIHTAARVHGLMGNAKFPVDVFEENTTINTNVVRAGRLTGVKKFVVAGTVAAYPASVIMNINEDDFLNGEPHAGERAYAYSKRAMLAHLEACKAQNGIDFTYAVLTNLYGPRDRFDIEHGHVIPSLIAKFHAAAANGSKVDVWGTGRARRDFLYIEDAASALIRMTETGDGIINVASGESVPIAAIVEILSTISGVDKINWQTEKPEGQLERSYDVERLRALDFMPTWSLERGLAETYEWYDKHHNH